MVRALQHDISLQAIFLLDHTQQFRHPISIDIGTEDQVVEKRIERPVLFEDVALDIATDDRLKSPESLVMSFCDGWIALSFRGAAQCQENGQLLSNRWVMLALMV